MTDRPRLIAHLDMDAFYASVELLRYPELRGTAGRDRRRPAQARTTRRTAREQRFATLRDYVGRGVATTATYEARALGVHSGMGLMKAARLAPDAILLPVDFDAYRRYSRLFKARGARDRAADRGPRHRRDLHRSHRRRTRRRAVARDERRADRTLRARALAQAIKDAVRAATGLSCSIGVAPNKLLAKIASELDKPDGLTIVTPDDIASRIWPLPARKINGIGPKAAAKLEALGIRTIGELAHADPAWLVEHFGRHYGAWMHEAAHGRDDRPVVTAQRAEVDQPRDDVRPRPVTPTRDRAELVADLHRAVRAASPTTCARKGYVGGARSASSCASTISTR